MSENWQQRGVGGGCASFVRCSMSPNTILAYPRPVSKVSRGSWALPNTWYKLLAYNAIAGSVSLSAAFLPVARTVPVTRNINVLTDLIRTHHRRWTHVVNYAEIGSRPLVLPITRPNTISIYPGATYCVSLYDLAYCSRWVSQDFCALNESCRLCAECAPDQVQLN